MDEHVQQPQEEILSQTAQMVEIAVSELEALKAQALSEKDKYVRLLAEFENMRKRQERERMDLIKYAHEEVIVESLKIYDDLQRSLDAFKAKPETDANLVKGLEMVFNNMKELMLKYDVKPIESVGKPFDPNSQEPLMQMETTDVPDGQVVEEFQKGYTMSGRVVRTAKVKVAKNNG